MTDVTGIEKQFCLHGNGVNLDKLMRWQLEYPDPTPAFGAMYMPRPATRHDPPLPHGRDLTTTCGGQRRTPGTSGTCGATPPAPRPTRWSAMSTRNMAALRRRLGERLRLPVREVRHAALAHPGAQGGPVRPVAGERIHQRRREDQGEGGRRLLRQLALGLRPLSAADGSDQRQEWWPA